MRSGTWKKQVLAALLVAAAVGATGAEAQASKKAAPKPLVITAENITAAAAGAPARSTSVLREGDAVRYRLVFTNVNADSVRNVQFTDAISTGFRYVAGSAKADQAAVAIDFSIDGGKSWSAQPTVEVMEDGRPVRRPAPAERYTHVRWTDRAWVQPKSTVAAEFTAQLQSSPAVANR